MLDDDGLSMGNRKYIEWMLGSRKDQPLEQSPGQGEDQAAW